jgi:hypothetical protein
LLAFGRDPKARYSPFDSTAISSSPLSTVSPRIDHRARGLILLCFALTLRRFLNLPLRS